MAKYPAWSLLAIFSLLTVKVLSNDLDLTDALGAPTNAPAPKPEPEPAEVTGGDSNLDQDDKPPTKQPEQVITTATATKAPVKIQPKTANQEDLTQKDIFAATVRPVLLPRSTTRAPRTTRPPSRLQPAPDDFDLSDALDPKNDIGGKDKNSKGDKGFGSGGRGDGRPNNRGGNSDGKFSDDDLFDTGKDNGYSPDKGKGEREGGTSPQDNNNYDTMAETGTIAGIVSAVAMALVGAVSSYISYQKKKLCFSIQQGLNAEVTKGENPEAVVSQEPQAQQTLLQSPNAETPNNENTL
ncbi:CD99 antigen-like protein 2 isoform X1 [Anguilla anguilla]|uniref:CD99 antigen-like protein 2 isoform X1 n=1 Tax=Anguilla anguilla TaxID=7936 RepID=UPI0015ACB452|nr:CD99 antigen-like protein 2 isoform X1 [Anguilla anguilla]